ncbi:hypothetical protein DFS33DRAFT_1423092 [Desarmillaria ectypa]|nr:hypothetical protein DFS33DRAFT_1423092 [Desarmillaria ectypa]
MKQWRKINESQENDGISSEVDFDLWAPICSVAVIEQVSGSSRRIEEEEVSLSGPPLAWFLQSDILRESRYTRTSGQRQKIIHNVHQLCTVLLAFGVEMNGGDKLQDPLMHFHGGLAMLLKNAGRNINNVAQQVQGVAEGLEKLLEGIEATVEDNQVNTPHLRTDAQTDGIQAIFVEEHRCTAAELECSSLHIAMISRSRIILKAAHRAENLSGNVIRKAQVLIASPFEDYTTIRLLRAFTTLSADIHDYLSSVCIEYGDTKLDVAVDGRLMRLFLVDEARNEGWSAGVRGDPENDIPNWLTPSSVIVKRWSELCIAATVPENTTPITSSNNVNIHIDGVFVGASHNAVSLDRLGYFVWYESFVGELEKAAEQWICSAINTLAHGLTLSEMKHKRTADNPCGTAVMNVISLGQLLGASPADGPESISFLSRVNRSLGYLPRLRMSTLLQKFQVRSSTRRRDSWTWSNEREQGVIAVEELIDSTGDIIVQGRGEIVLGPGGVRTQEPNSGGLG